MAWRHIKHGITAVLLLVAAVAGGGLIYAQVKGIEFLSVQSGSMAPALVRGDVVTVRRVPQADLAVGDVVTFMHPDKVGQTITHRIIQLPSVNNNHQLITKGDANGRADEAIDPSMIVGRVDFHAPKVGTALDFIRTPLGVSMLIYVPAAIVVLSEIRKLAAYYRSQRYVLPEVLARRRRQSSHALRNTLAASVVITLAIGAVALPVRAALFSMAALSNNTLSVAGTATAEGGVQLRRVFVTCSAQDSDTATTLDTIFYNDSKHPVALDGWTLQTGDYTLSTFPADTSIAGRSLLDSEVAIAPGLTYGAGTLTLRNSNGQIIDEMTWSHIAADRSCQVTR